MHNVLQMDREVQVINVVIRYKSSGKGEDNPVHSLVCNPYHHVIAKFLFPCHM